MRHIRYTFHGMFESPEVTLDTWTWLLPVLFIAAGGWLIHRVYWERRISRWARGHHFTLVDCRRAWMIEGPDRLTRNNWRTVFWIEVTDRDGFARTGYLTFQSRWWGGIDDEIEWN